MARQVQLRRGTTAENDNFIGAAGELTFDTSTGAVRAHDGTKQGGHMLDSVVAYKLPTSESKTWYRKYASGWVEQGGAFTNSAKVTTITFPVAMADTNYKALSNLQHGDSGWTSTTTTCIANGTRTTTSMGVQCYYNSSFTTGLICWEVAGLAA